MGCWWFSCIPCVLRTRPLRCAKGRETACFVFLWVPASAGMTDRRVKSPGRYLIRSCCVNDLGFAPPPKFGGGCVDRSNELVCYQQSNTGACFAKRIAPGSDLGWKRMPEHQPNSSARVVKCQLPRHDPHHWLWWWCQSLGWTLAHAVVAPLQLKGIDLTRVHEVPTGPHRLWLSRLVCIATTASSAATGLSCEVRFSRNQNKTTHWSSATSGGVGWGGVACALS